MNLSGRAFILVQYSENVILGNRGFTKDEKENGIVLVFNPKMNFLWNEYGITAMLVFGTSPQKCYIPDNDIVAVYSPDLKCQFLATPYSFEDVNSQHKEEQIHWENHREHADYKLTRKKEKDLNMQNNKKQKNLGISKISSTEGESDKNVIKVDFTKKRK